MITPEWVSLVAPFVSGGIGAIVGNKIAVAVLRQQNIELERRLNVAEARLELQVGENRCDKMRAECKDNFKQALDDIKSQILSNRDYVVERFEEIAKFMGSQLGR